MEKAKDDASCSARRLGRVGGLMSRRLRYDDLGPLRRLFVVEYLRDLNSRLAYQRAAAACGRVVQDNSAHASACKLLSDPRIVAEIKAGMARRARRIGLSADWVVSKLVEQVGRAMQAEPVTDVQGKPTGEYRYEGAVANKALELLGRHLGMFQDKIKITVSLDDVRAMVRQALDARNGVPPMPLLPSADAYYSADDNFAEVGNGAPATG